MQKKKLNREQLSLSLSLCLCFLSLVMWCVSVIVTSSGGELVMPLMGGWGAGVEYS